MLRSWSPRSPRPPGTSTWGRSWTDYERAGVLEYVVRALDPDEVIWFEQDQGVLNERPIPSDGIYRSAVFPGLWLDPLALSER